MGSRKKTAYSILDLAIVSEGSTPKDTFANSLILAKVAEELGYTRFWLAEHHNSKTIASTTPPVLIGYIAENTHTIRVGAGGIMLPNHSPLIVAEQFGTLGTLYPNRIDLGLGRAPGTDQVTAHAIRPDRMKSVYHFPQEVQQIQQYFSTANADAKVRVPIAEGVALPIYILGSRAEFQPSPYLAAPYTLAGVNVIAADTQEQAERISTTLIRAILGIITGNRECLQPPMKMTEELRQVARHPAIRQMLHHSFIGNSTQVKQQATAFIHQTQIDELIVATHVYHTKDRLLSYQLFAQIMQELEQEPEGVMMNGK